MKKTALIALALFSATSFADGEWTVFKCVSATNSGRIVTIKGCANEGSLVPCANESFEFVTITRETSVAKMTPDMVETIKIPGRLFDFVWEEELFSLSLNDKLIGAMSLNYVGGENKDEPQSWILDLGNIKHSFKAVGCEFTSN